MLEILFLIIGIIGLFAGAELVIEAAKKFATALHLNELIVGLTLVAIGTSLPEIAVNMAAGFSQAGGIETSGIAVGNIIGSQISNITLILGILGLLAVLQISKRELVHDGAMMVFAFAAFMAAAFDKVLTFGEGILLVLIYLLYIVYLGKRNSVMKTGPKSTEKINPLIQLAFLLGGIGLVIFASDLVVANGVVIATQIGINEFIIGLLVGLGTSLPELAITVNAVRNGAKKMAIGNLLGSNIANPLLALGLGMMAVGPVNNFTIEEAALGFGVPYWLLATLIVLTFLWQKNGITRIKAVFLIGAYIAFLALQTFLLS